MEPRRKPIPNPLPRASGVRALVATGSYRALPTVAALLAATSLLACKGESTDITADQLVMQASVHSEVALDPLPGMGALETEAEPPPPKPDPVITPRPRPVIKPPPIPVVTGGAPPPVTIAPKHAGAKPAVVPKTI